MRCLDRTGKVHPGNVLTLYFCQSNMLGLPRLKVAHSRAGSSTEHKVGGFSDEFLPGRTLPELRWPVE